MEHVLSIEEAFGELKVPRGRASVNALSEMLTVAPCAILSGADSWVAIQTLGEANLDWWRRDRCTTVGRVTTA